MFSSYNYGDLESSDDDDETEHQFLIDANFGEWTYLYFGYSFHTKELYAYVKYYDREDSHLFTETY